MSSSLGRRTQKVPRPQDWYFDLRPIIPLFRALVKPAPSNLTSGPAYKSCRESRLYRDISAIHAAIVSPRVLCLLF